MMGRERRRCLLMGFSKGVITRKQRKTLRESRYRSITESSKPGSTILSLKQST
jgi:hypothetical protein